MKIICLFSMLPSCIMVLKLSTKCIFCNFVLTSPRNLSRLKQFTYMHLKSLVTNFQKLMFFYFFLFENSQKVFWCGPPFGPFWSVKYLNFGQKLMIRTTPCFFYKVDTPRLLKIHIMFCPSSGAKKS